MNKFIFVSLCLLFLFNFACNNKKKASTKISDKTETKVIKSLGETLKRIKGGGVLRIGMDPTELPWCKATKKNEYIGYEVEIAKLLVKKLTKYLNLKKDIKLKIVTSSWHQLPDQLINRKIDIIGGTWTPTKETKQNIAWSYPYHEWGLLIAVLKENPAKSLEDLKNQLVARYDDPSSVSIFNKMGLTKVNVYTSGNVAIKALLDRQIEAFIYDSPYLKYHAKLNTKIKIIGNRLSNSTYNYGIRKKEKDLLEFVNQAVKEIINSSEYHDIMTKWFG